MTPGPVKVGMSLSRLNPVLHGKLSAAKEKAINRVPVRPRSRALQVMIANWHACRANIPAVPLRAQDPATVATASDLKPGSGRSNSLIPGALTPSKQGSDLGGLLFRLRYRIIPALPNCLQIAVDADRSLGGRPLRTYANSPMSVSAALCGF